LPRLRCCLAGIGRAGLTASSGALHQALVTRSGEFSLVERSIAIEVGRLKVADVRLRLRLGDGGSATRVGLLSQSVALTLAYFGLA
jgi:hypothetical protein